MSSPETLIDAVRFSAWERFAAAISALSTLIVATWLAFSEDSATSAAVAAGAILISAAFGYAAISGQPLTAFKLPGGGEFAVNPYARQLERMVQREDVPDEAKTELGQEAANAGLLLPVGARTEISEARHRQSLAQKYRKNLIAALERIDDVQRSYSSFDSAGLGVQLSSTNGERVVRVEDAWVSENGDVTSRVRRVMWPWLNSNRIVPVLVVTNVKLPHDVVENQGRAASAQIVTWRDQTDDAILSETVRSILNETH